MNLKSILLVSALGIVGAANAVPLAVWNFNDGANGIYSPANTASLFAVDRGAGTMTSNFTEATGNGITAFAGTTVGADSSDVAGQALTLQEGGTSGAPVNAGASLTFGTSTVGLNSIMVSFAIQRTTTGFDSDQFQYSTNGTTFTNFGALFTPAAAFAAVSFDLSGVSGLSNNANAAFRIVFNNTAAVTSSAAGNNRLDNLVVSGTQAVPEPSAFAALGLGAVAILRRRRSAK